MTTATRVKRAIGTVLALALVIVLTVTGVISMSAAMIIIIVGGFSFAGFMMWSSSSDRVDRNGSGRSG